MIAWRYTAAAAVLCALMLALFGLAQMLNVPLLSDESPDLGSTNVPAAAASFALLVVDAVLPVPSSGVMIANGALFGWLPATALSLSGSIAAALLCCALGRRGGRLVGRLTDSHHATGLPEALDRRGTLLVLVTRPVPIVAETTAILAGAAGMPYRRVGAAAAIGSLPPALAYSLAGAAADGFAHPAVVFAGVIALTALAWRCNIAQLRVQRRAVRRRRTSLVRKAQTDDDVRHSPGRERSRI